MTHVPFRPILITGAAGFIGSHVAQRLLSLGRPVVGVDNFDPFYARAAKERNLAEVRAISRDFECINADISDAAAMRTHFERVRPSGVIHLAGKAGVRPSIADPVGYARTNVTGTMVVQKAALDAGCDRLVVASSSSVYGNAPKVPFSETDDVSEPISPYAATKRAGELIGYTHHLLTKMPTAQLRFFTVFGPRQRPDLAISLFMRRIALGDPITVFGDGSMSRDFTFIDDIVAGVLAAYDRIPAHGYRIWNLGSDHPVALRDMVRAIERTVGRDAIITPAPQQAGDVNRTWADLSRSSAELGYAPSTPFEEGLAQQWAWLKTTL